jgi:hypothetical protein
VLLAPRHEYAHVVAGANNPDLARRTAGVNIVVCVIFIVLILSG